MKNVNKKKVNAYLTVEASFLLPLLIMLIMIICTIMFFLFNCCVTYQACYISSLRGSQLMDMSSGEIEKRVKDYMDELLDNQIYDFTKDSEVDVGIMSIKTKAKTQTDNIFSFSEVFSNIQMKNEYKAEARRLDPIKLIRTLH